MPYAVYKGESAVADLVKRLYQIKGPKAKSLTAKAEKALLRANPRLAELKKKDAGAIILVPDISGVKTSAEVQRAEAVHSEILAEIRTALDSIGPVLDEAFNREMDQAKKAQKEMRSARVKKMFAAAPDIQAKMPGIAAKAKTRGEEAKTRKALYKRAILQLKKDLDVFEKGI